MVFLGASASSHNFRFLNIRNRQCRRVILAKNDEISYDIFISNIFFFGI